ncbi:MAG: hypothetical protein V4813_12750 [Gemmatimonadota bacterium]
MLRHLLWIDSGAGLLNGALTLTLSAWLSDLYALPRPMLVAMGVTNLAYGTYSGVLASSERRPMALLVVLVIANATWALGCLLAAHRFRGLASPVGVAQLATEGLLVGGLAALEWRLRAQLTARR